MSKGNFRPIRSHEPTDAYRDGWDRIFGKKEEVCPKCAGTGEVIGGDADPIVEPCPVCKAAESYVERRIEQIKKYGLPTRCKAHPDCVLLRGHEGPCELASPLGPRRA